MKITLFLTTGLFDFSLPNDISGSYSFDSNIDENSKLINVEAREGKWVIYSTTDVKILSGNQFVNEAYLMENYFYILRRNDIDYLIYAEIPAHGNMAAYNCPENANIIIGNNENSNVKYNCSLLNNSAIKISYVDNKLTLQRTNNELVYVNSLCIKETNYSIKNGDQINIYGLKIIFLPGYILVNNPGGLVTILNTSNLTDKIIEFDDNCVEEEVKDVDLYNKNDYFSKPPRIRRVIEEKSVKIDAPPKTTEPNTPPAILTIGPMLAMGVTSVVTFISTITKLKSGQSTMQEQLPRLITSGVMLMSSLLWPLLTNLYNKIHRKNVKRRTIKKYNKYLSEKQKELQAEMELQKNILMENLLSVKDCVNIINTKSINFWDKRIEQSDFLMVRLGVGDAPLKVNIEYQEEGFTIDEDELRKTADKAVNELKYIKDVPIGYSFYENKLTAIMGEYDQTHNFINNIILQLITFYSYEDLKLVVFTNKENEKRWDYIKYLSHNFDNSKRFRFFSSDLEEVKEISEYIEFEMNMRLQMEDDRAKHQKPYYLIIIDDYDMVKRFDFIKTLTEMDNNIGFSIIIAENRMSKIPSKCINFITLGEERSSVLLNSYEKQESTDFTNEIDTSIDMNQIAKILSNIPIEFEEGNKQLPDSITFLEMEKVSKVEQLNILNRWNTNNSTTSLKAEIGVDENGDLMYLDLHEKKHGPHGLIAGMTGSGKSEFIITYILSMAINYSPDDVSFILIDYKGGGLAFAFENQATGMSLPHLAGIITNLDKAEMNRTLVSIDSEIKRRQRVFNEARDALGESTIDIYKYQQFFKEGKLTEAVPHLFIICDEFAELKSQQPEFMDNLISVARIGRSLGVHLILATQKPSGVVNDQIWSNTKFRVCLKVQTQGDSNEMLKRPDAASIKQTGRFYLQVGYDEYFALGQSAWCGAKYYPSDKIIKTVDKSINFISNTGSFIKSIQAGDNNTKREAQGEQLANIMKNIIAVSKETNKKATRLWLENIKPIIFVDNLKTKYEFKETPFNINAIAGEYDAPENQEQGLLTFSFNDKGNCIIYGNDATEKENLLNSIIYSTITNHSPEELNYYIVDYGSETLRKYSKAPHIGGMVFSEEKEPLNNLIKLITNEINERKQLFSEYGGEYNSYIKQSGKTLPMMTIIINNYDAFSESNNTLTDTLVSLTRDSQRYGIIFIITCNSTGSITRRITQNFETTFVMHMTDTSAYYSMFNVKNRLTPRDIPGRGLGLKDNVVHEFQTASIAEEDNLNEFVKATIDKLNTTYQTKAKPIPSLPNQVTFDMISSYIKDFKHIPVGISRETLDVVKYDFSSNISTQIISNKIENGRSFITSLVKVFTSIENTNLVFIDSNKIFPNLKESLTNYFDDNFEGNLPKITDFIKKIKTDAQDNSRTIIMISGIEKLKSKVSDMKIIENLVNESIGSENINIIIYDGVKQFKSIDFDEWYSKLKNSSDGIWIGSGIGEQSAFRLSKVTKEMSAKCPNNIGFVIKESDATRIKLLEFEVIKEEEDE
ncbi:MAG: type VII secretion protein EssC [Bacilli bacterium]|nr:type VII secretion protein EssC [Bacilli bacterium]